MHRPLFVRSRQADGPPRDRPTRSHGVACTWLTDHDA